MIRYFPAKWTAGLARSLVRGWSREPWPPARIMAKRFSIVVKPWEGVAKEVDWKGEKTHFREGKIGFTAI